MPQPAPKSKTRCSSRWPARCPRPKKRSISSTHRRRYGARNDVRGRDLGSHCRGNAARLECSDVWSEYGHDRARSHAQEIRQGPCPHRAHFRNRRDRNRDRRCHDRPASDCRAMDERIHAGRVRSGDQRSSAPALHVGRPGEGAGRLQGGLRLLRPAGPASTRIAFITR